MKRELRLAEKWHVNNNDDDDCNDDCDDDYD